MDSKKCNKCKEETPLTEFSPNRNNKDGLGGWCKSCARQYRRQRLLEHPEKARQPKRTYRKRYPWAQHLENIVQRCGNPKSRKYHRYGGRGIKCLLTMKDIKSIWFKDKAYGLDRPSIDRINNDGNYTLENCRFIELSENGSKGAK